LDSQFDGGDSGNTVETDRVGVGRRIDSGDLDLVLDECGKLFVLWGEGDTISTPRRHTDQPTNQPKISFKRVSFCGGEEEREISQSNDPGVSIIDLVDRIFGEGDNITWDLFLVTLDDWLLPGEEKVFHLRDKLPGPVEEGTKFSRSRVSSEKLSVLEAASKREKEEVDQDGDEDEWSVIRERERPRERDETHRLRTGKAVTSCDLQNSVVCAATKKPKEKEKKELIRTLVL